MKVIKSMLVLFVFLAGLPAQASAEFDFSLLVDDVNVSARSDMSRFEASIASEFGVSVARVEQLVATLGSPGDAYLSLKVSKLSGRSVDEVVHLRRSSPGEGWGKTAQRMGIKPGSDEFMQLKQPSGKQQKHKEKNKNKSKDKNHKD